MFHGSMTALLTPMQADGAIDGKALADLVDWQIDQGTAAIVPVGTTGESATLSIDEHHYVIELAVRTAKKRIPVIAGVGSNSTAATIALAKHAQAVGADAIMAVAPYYNRPTQEGLYRHFIAIADAVELPLILYNIPSRSVVDISIETMARLARHQRIVGVKDATANLARPLHTRAACGPDFVQLSGEDHTAVAFLAAGGQGCISVTANVAPRLCAQLHSAWHAGRVAEVIAAQDRLLVLHDALFCESSPAPAKFAASLLGFGTDMVRLPLVPATDTARDRVRAALDALGLYPPRQT